MPARAVAQPANTDINTTTSDYLSRSDVNAYLQELAKEKGIDLKWLQDEVAVARYSRLTEKYMTPRPHADKKTTPERNFLLYSRNLINAERIDKGAEFVTRNAATLERIEKETGVDRYAITAIIGVESIYGKNMGRFKVLDALMTLSFDYTRRANYYKKELASFLTFCWQQHISPVSVQGSFAGAIGLGQFLPTSLEAYGRDGDGDGHIDIINNEDDGIASVANFLKVHGWARGEKPLYRVTATPKIFKSTRSGGINAHTTVGALLKAGVVAQESWELDANEPVLLVDLPWIAPDNSKGIDYYLGTRSFAAILRYNRSYFYAAAVSQLAERIAEKVNDTSQSPAGDTAARTPS